MLGSDGIIPALGTFQASLVYRITGQPELHRNYLVEEGQECLVSSRQGVGYEASGEV